MQAGEGGLNEENDFAYKKENLTLRIEPEILEAIKQKSKTEKVSINNIVNKMLQSYTDWNQYAPDAGWVPMPKQLLGHLMEKCSENEISELAHKKGKDIAQDILLFMNGRYDLESWINFLKNRASASGFRFSEQRDRNSIRCLLHHELGRGWSIWFKCFYEIVFTDLGKKVDFEISENTLAIKITL